MHSVCLHSVISNINCCKLDSGRLFKGFYSSILNVNVWLLHRRCNLLWISCIQASWRGFISMLMPRGRIFALLPACYYSAVHFMLLSVTLQQGAHHWEQDHTTVLNSIAVSFCSVKLLTDVFLMSFFNVMIAVKNDIHQFNIIFTPEATTPGLSKV